MINDLNFHLEKFRDPYINAIKRKVLKYFLEEFEDYLASKCCNDMPVGFIDSLNLTKEQESKIILEICNEIYNGDCEQFPVRSIYQIQDFVWLSYVKGLM